MTNTINNIEFTINMDERNVEAREDGRLHVYSFRHFNAEDCDTAEEVIEMIHEWIEETAA